MKSAQQVRAEREELGHAYERFIDLLSKASYENGDHPVISMITKHWNRGTGTFCVQVFLVIRETGEIVDISTEVAWIIGCRYGRANRGVLITAIGMDCHHAILHSLSLRMRGQTGMKHEFTQRSL